MVAIMSQSKKQERNYADLLDTTDVGYLASQYGEEEAFVRGMNDAEWCEYLGCTISELPYYLFDGAGEEFHNHVYEMDEGEPDDDTFTEGTLFDIEDYLQKEFSKPAPKVVTKPAPKTTALAHNYSRPSAFASPKPKVVPHHFEVVK